MQTRPELREVTVEEQTVVEGGKLSRDHVAAMKDVFKKCLDLKSQSHDAVDSFGR